MSIIFPFKKKVFVEICPSCGVRNTGTVCMHTRMVKCTECMEQSLMGPHIEVQCGECSAFLSPGEYNSHYVGHWRLTPEPWNTPPAVKDYLFRRQWPGRDPKLGLDCPDCQNMGGYGPRLAMTACLTCNGVTTVPPMVAKAFKVITCYKVVCHSGRDLLVSASVIGKLETVYTEDEWTFTKWPQFVFKDRKLAVAFAERIADTYYPCYEVWECDGLNVRRSPERISGLPSDILHLGADSFWEFYLHGKGEYGGCFRSTPAGSYIADRVMLRRMLDEITMAEEEEMYEGR